MQRFIHAHGLRQGRINVWHPSSRRTLPTRFGTQGMSFQQVRFRGFSDASGNSEEPPVVPICLRTLSPRSLSPEDYVDLSDSTALVLDPTASASPHPIHMGHSVPSITYGLRMHPTASSIPGAPQYTPFPVNTRGFFYYYKDHEIPFGGSLRFRVTQKPNLGLFLHGQDLLTEYGTVWEMPLLLFANLERYALLKTILHRDGLIEPDFSARYANILGQANDGYSDPYSQLVYRCGQAFYVDLTRPHQRIYVTTGQVCYCMTPRDVFLPYNELFDDPRLAAVKASVTQRWPFKAGVLICRLERPIRESTVVVRVLRIVEPVRTIENLAEATETVDLPIITRERLKVEGEYHRPFNGKPGTAAAAVQNYLVRTQHKRLKRFLSKAQNLNSPRSAGAALTAAIPLGN
ncbi:hypothetical protein BD414DRAFT_471644 [Trametes punicea]|nr:hypothetical protein BD414DRAFT_471644 [Trametes punicea]